MADRRWRGLRAGLSRSTHIRAWKGGDCARGGVACRATETPKSREQEAGRGSGPGLSNLVAGE